MTLFRKRSSRFRIPPRLDMPRNLLATCSSVLVSSWFLTLSQFPMSQVVSVAFHPVAVHLQEEPCSVFSAPSHRAVALSNRLSSSLPLLKAGQTQLLQLLLAGMCSSPSHRRGLLWGSLRYITSLSGPVCRSPDAVFQVWRSLFPWLDGIAQANTAHFVVSLYPSQVTSQAHSPLTVHEDPQVLSCKVVFYSIDAHLYQCMGLF